MKTRLRKVEHRSKEILIVDYSDLKEEGMIDLFTAAKELVVKEGKQVLVLSIFNKKNYVSPNFLKHVETGLRQADSLILRNAITGMSDIQRWIIKAINLWYEKQLHPFDSKEDALDFLVS